MARKEESQSRAATERRVITPRFVIRVLIAAVAMVGAVYAWHKLEGFLIRDARFALAIPDYGPESPSLRIEGLQYASRPQVLQVFAPDYGSSLYLLPLRQRREQLKAIDWVRNASVSRLWPNSVAVHLEEREPVAFLNVPSGRSGIMQTLLIDAEGVVLQPPSQARFKLPVVQGIKPDQSPEDRRHRVARLTTLMHDIGGHASDVSEVDVTNLENLRVTARADRRAVLLILGDRNFGRRFQNYVANFPRILERIPNAHILDLRLDDRITVVEEDKQ